MDHSFEHITSTEHAMSLLQQFQAILQRETLRNDLESKWVAGAVCVCTCVCMCTSARVSWEGVAAGAQCGCGAS